MVFASITFIYIFIPLFFVCYIISKHKNFVLCIFSLIFYAMGEPIYILLMLFVSYINYYFGKKIGLLDEKLDENIAKLKSINPQNESIKDVIVELKKAFNNNKFILLMIAVSIDIIVLVIFKYLNNITNFFYLRKLISFNTNIKLPIGISFYIFQSISYVADVYKKDCRYQPRFINLLLYISMFPQLIAGPIVRYKDVDYEIENRKVNVDDVYYGIGRVVYGLAKKVVIANQLSLLISELMGTSKVGNIFAIFVFMLQMYYDFSGYSDIAIGLGRILGFHFLENFNYPYISTSITEFWRRWHISLNVWFRDYLYYPVLMSDFAKKIKEKLTFISDKASSIVVIVFAMLIVWTATGIWHGASLNFMIWGLYYFVILTIELLFLKKFLSINNIIVKFIGHIYVLVVLLVGYMIFYFEDFNLFKVFIDELKTKDLISYETRSIILNNIYLLIIAIVFSTPIINFVKEKLSKIRINNYVKLFVNSIYCVLKTFILIVLIVCVTILLIGETNNPFLYFRF